MKAATSLLFLAAAAYAADLSSVSECGNMCISNMKAKAGELGCAADDMGCLCTKMDFSHGVHDCTAEACGDADVAAAEAAARQLCDEAGEGSSPTGTDGGDSGTATATGTGVAPTGTDGSGSQTGGEGTATATGSETGGSPQSTPYTTEPVVSTVTSDGQAQETTVGSTTLYTQVAPGGTGTDGGDAEPTATGTSGNGGDGEASETGGEGSGPEPTGTDGSGSGSGSDDSGSGDATATGGDGATSTGAAQALATHAGGMVGAFGLAALLVL